MFATAHHSSKGHESPDYVGHRHMTDLKNSSAIRADRELHHNRWMAVGVLVLFVAMIAFLLTIAVIGGSSINTGNTGYEFWMMP